MNEKNNFQRLADLEEISAPSAPRGIESKVSETLGFISHLANIFDLYIPKLFGLLVVLMGGKVGR